MKNPLSDIYEQVLLNEAEKHSLQNPSQDEVGNLKPKAELFGSKPKAVQGPDKAKLQQGPKYKETTGSTSTPTAKSAQMLNSKPAQDHKSEKTKEMKDTDVDPTEEEETEEEKKDVKKESVSLGAFEALFKKTLTEEMHEDEMSEESDTENEENEEMEESEDLDLEEGEDEEEEGDLVSDLKDLQDRLASILSKLEDVAEENEEEMSDEDYSEEDFEEEFGNEESEEEFAMKESIDKPKALNNSKGKVLTKKKNKVGKITPKGKKAHSGKVVSAPAPKALGDKKAHLQKGKCEVKSTVKKGDFIK
jgi:hypothetical protein